MNSSNLFSPESAAAGQKNEGRARVKIAVFSVLAVHVAGLMALLLTQGCRRETPPEENLGQQPELPMMDTNTLPMVDTNLPPLTNLPPYGDPMTNAYIPPTPPEPVAPAATKYVIQPGDSFYSIAKNHGVTMKAIELANPGVDPKRLQPKQEINLPAPGTGVAAPATTTTTADAGGPTIYTVKSGDTLTKIASRFGTTTKAIKSLNGLTTDQIRVSQKLKIPVKPAAPEPPAVAPITPAPAPAQ